MLQTVGPKTEISEGQPGKTRAYRIDTMAVDHVLQMLCNLYRNPVLAVVREYCANAIDAHRMVEIRTGVKPQPFEVTLPNASNMVFRVRDFGAGLSDDEFDQYMLGCGNSAPEKRDIATAEQQIGAFGAGAKCGFAVTDQFCVTVWHAGIKTIYRSYMTAQGKGMNEMIYREASDEPTGVAIDIPCTHKIIEKFQPALRRVLMFMDPQDRPLVDGQDASAVLGLDCKPFMEGKISDPSYPDLLGWSVWEYGGNPVLDHSGHQLYCVQGGQVVPVETEWLRSSGERSVSGITGSAHLVLFCRNGSLPLQPSREGIVENPVTADKLLAIFSHIKPIMTEVVRRKLADCRTVMQFTKACSSIRQTIVTSLYDGIETPACLQSKWFELTTLQQYTREVAFNNCSFSTFTGNKRRSRTGFIVRCNHQQDQFNLADRLCIAVVRDNLSTSDIAAIRRHLRDQPDKFCVILARKEVPAEARLMNDPIFQDIPRLDLQKVLDDRDAIKAKRVMTPRRTAIRTVESAWCRCTFTKYGNDHQHAMPADVVNGNQLIPCLFVKHDKLVVPYCPGGAVWRDIKGSQHAELSELCGGRVCNKLLLTADGTVPKQIKARVHDAFKACVDRLAAKNPAVVLCLFGDAFDRELVSRTGHWAALSRLYCARRRGTALTGWLEAYNNYLPLNFSTDERNLARSIGVLMQVIAKREGWQPYCEGKETRADALRASKELTKTLSRLTQDYLRDPAIATQLSSAGREELETIITKQGR